MVKKIAKILFMIADFCPLSLKAHTILKLESLYFAWTQLKPMPEYTLKLSTNLAKGFLRPPSSKK